MKKVPLFILVLFLFVGLSYAETVTTSHADGSWQAPDPYLQEWLNANNIDHTHLVNVPDRDNEVGVGLDLVLLQTTTVLEEVTGEVRYDFNNDDGEWKAYLVGRVNLWGALQGE